MKMKSEALELGRLLDGTPNKEDFLLNTETYFRAWKASLDGKEA